MHTWQTEIAKELKTQQQSADLSLLIDELETRQMEHFAVAERLDNLQLGYFAAKLLDFLYDERATTLNKEQDNGIATTESHP